MSSPKCPNLSKTIDKIKDAPDIIKGTRADLQTVEPVLCASDMALQGDGSQSPRVTKSLAQCIKDFKSVAILKFTFSI